MQSAATGFTLEVDLDRMHHPMKNAFGYCRICRQLVSNADAYGGRLVHRACRLKEMKKYTADTKNPGCAFRQPKRIKKSSPEYVPPEERRRRLLIEMERRLMAED